MADTLQFDLVSPERMLASVAASEVQIPGAEGDFTAMPGHAPFISTLRPGIVTAVTTQGEMKYVVTGGFAEVGAEAISLLAERGIPTDEMTQPTYDAMLADLRKAAGEASGDDADHAGKLVNDMVMVGQQLGLSTTAA
ncbi:MAG: F-type H+-transporting ATPase epsilon subunit AtpC [Rhodobacteraceae bacterium HLUCCA12]|nr:MAG: F-type H+-transporting ATPase epsilon subunit AtpC [Rhodobacteraceae bacterium HLUCCA12]